MSRFGSRAISALTACAALLAALVGTAAAATGDERVTSMISRGEGGRANGPTESPSVSASGRYVAFASTADNLSSADNDAVKNVYAYDLQTGNSVLVSRANGASGAAADGDSSDPAISANGRYVVFVSKSTNLGVPPIPPPQGSGNAAAPALAIYMRDLQTGATSIVSSGDVPIQPFVSGDGRYVVFARYEGVSGKRQIYVRDMQVPFPTNPNEPSGERVVSFNQGFGDKDSSEPVISANGEWVAFESKAGNLVSGDHSGRDVFARRRPSVDPQQPNDAPVILISRRSGASGAPADDVSSQPSISETGAYVAFSSRADNLSSADNDGVTNVFRRALGGRSRLTTLISRARGSSGAAGDDTSYAPSISGSGARVAFLSAANNLSDADSDSVTNVFVRTFSSSGVGTVLASRRHGNSGAGANGSSSSPWIAASGRAVVFASDADNLSTADDNAFQNLFLREL